MTSRERPRPSSVVIVGASVAGTRLAVELRRRGYEGGITLVNGEPHVPYDKPPLSKQAIAATPETVPTLLTEVAAAEARIELRNGIEAVGLRPAEHVVVLADGTELRGDVIVIATGVGARRLPVPEGLAGVFTLRTLSDAQRLTSELERRPRVVVIGAGFIGTEFASACRDRGLDVTVIEAQAMPMAHLFGEEVAKELIQLVERSGARLVTSARFARFLGTGRVTGVALEDGRELPADLVVVGIGTVPGVEWLSDSGLPVDNGVAVESDFAVPGFPGIYAIGDVASKPLPRGGRGRTEHWTTANEHAEQLAAMITDTDAPTAQPPYVWSDQFGTRIQVLGRPADGRLAETAGAVADGRYSAVWTDDDDSIVGALVVGDNKTTNRFRKAMRERTPFAQIATTVA